MYNRWTPSSRRDRRREGRRSRRAATRGTDRVFLVVAGLFILGTILILFVISILSGVL
jgi:hypothetical protein